MPFEISTISVRTLYSQTLAYQEASLPPTPGVYVWTVDMCHLTAMPVGNGLSALNSLLGTSRRTYHGRVGPYGDVLLRDSVPPLTSTKATHFNTVWSLPTYVRDSILTWATVLQRPLYVGKAGNLGIRLRQHLDGRTPLKEALRDASLDVVDCSIIVLPLIWPDPLGTRPHTADDSLEPDEVEDEDPILQANQQLASVLTIAEALLIRTSKPLLNERLE